MKSRDGETRAHVLRDVSSKEIHAAVRTAVAQGSTLFTDDHRAYLGLHCHYQHGSVNHSAGEYVSGDKHTNSIESFWATLKRSHYGIHHYWSKKHLHRYVNQFVFNANTNGLPAFDTDGNDCGITTVRSYVAGMEGRRLPYKELIADAA